MADRTVIVCDRGARAMENVRSEVVSAPPADARRRCVRSSIITLPSLVEHMCSPGYRLHCFMQRRISRLRVMNMKLQFANWHSVVSVFHDVQSYGLAAKLLTVLLCFCRLLRSDSSYLGHVVCGASRYKLVGHSAASYLQPPKIVRQ